MKADLKKQKLQQRETERRQRRWKMTIVAGLAILAGGFALTSFFTPDRIVGDDVGWRVSPHHGG